MKLNRFLLIAFFSALPLALPIGARAQNPPTPFERLTGRPGAAPSTRFALPDGVKLDDGLSEDEAVAIALWNNATFQADLAQLGLARANLVEAGLLHNPIFGLLFPVGPKQLEAFVNWPLDAFRQRPRRVAAARLDLDRVTESLVQNGLDLVRDVRLQYASLAMAEERARIAAEQTRERVEMVEIVNARFRAGESANSKPARRALTQDLPRSRPIVSGMMPRLPASVCVRCSEWKARRRSMSSRPRRSPWLRRCPI
jgi:cobalt-zinc-cadmium efflux system outer membrane protein